MRQKQWLLSGIIAFLFIPSNIQAEIPGDPPENYFVGSKEIGVVLSADGQILRLKWKKGLINMPVIAFSGITGCRQSGHAVVRRDESGALMFTRILVDDSLKRSCILIERFKPGRNSIRWELEIHGRGRPWSSEINTELDYPATGGTRFWTAWGAPQYDHGSVHADEGLADDLKPFHGGADIEGFIGPGNNQWIDPLVATPFMDTSYSYGLPHFTYENPRIAVCPFQGNLFCIPMCSILEPGKDVGMTLALSPEDDLVDLDMNTSHDGHVRFIRLFNRISPDHTLHFSMDITAHAADCRGGLGWMVDRYPDYFLPKNNHSYRLAGTGAYAGPFEVIENHKMQEMDFTTNWEASFDFPYMGMFLPPLKNDQTWKRFGDSVISIDRMEEYASRMKKSGFHVLNYFNVTEFGAHVKYPPPPADKSQEKDWWKDCNTFLYRKLPHAILPVPVKMKKTDGRMISGGPIYTWEDGIVMDCGDRAYKDFLLDQAARHITEIPDADGICIDRMDWLRMFNEQADDGRTWFEDRPVRSLIHSFKELLDTLGPMMHRAGKNIFVNNHDKRLDLLRQADGIFDEFTYAGAPLNLTALLCVEKPALGWTNAAATVKKEGADNFFQKYLYMGVFPMCPYPANDHSIMPDTLADGYYIEYGPLLRLMHGRKWVLRPHVIEVENKMARANLFRTPGGYLIPVVYGKANHVTVHFRIGENNDAGPRIVSCEAWYPGKKEGVPLKPVRRGDAEVLELPLIRGCAMVSVKCLDK